MATHCVLEGMGKVEGDLLLHDHHPEHHPLLPHVLALTRIMRHRSYCHLHWRRINESILGLILVEASTGDEYKIQNLGS